MGGRMLALSGPSPLWYLTRGTGVVALLLLTAALTLGIVNQGRYASARWPRFVTGGLHRNVSLLVVVVLVVHILTAELDTFAPVGWAATIVPFASAYRPIWLGLGTLAFDLLLALVVTSLLRARIGLRIWRGVHWAAYGSWPTAVVHGLGTGSDARLAWVQGVTLACGVTVLLAGLLRLAGAPTVDRRRRLALASAGVIVASGIGLWASVGPLRPGWARRAGTPSNLLASTRTGHRASPGVPAPAPPAHG